MQQNLTQKCTGVETLTFAKRTDLASLKLDFHRLDIDTLKTTSVDSR